MKNVEKKTNKENRKNTVLLTSILERVNLDEIVPDFDVEKINAHTYKFSIKNLIYNVDIIESINLKTSQKILEIKFRLMNNPKAPDRKNFRTDQQYNIAVQKFQVGITGTGSSQKVFSKVIGTFITAAKELKPDYITFTADESSRQSLYDKIINIIQKYIPFKYKKLSHNPLTNDTLEPNEFWLKIQK
jgi:hypothetical protein